MSSPPAVPEKTSLTRIKVKNRHYVTGEDWYDTSFTVQRRMVEFEGEVFYLDELPKYTADKPEMAKGQTLIEYDTPGLRNREEFKRRFVNKGEDGKAELGVFQKYWFVNVVDNTLFKEFSKLLSNITSNFPFKNAIKLPISKEGNVYKIPCSLRDRNILLNAFTNYRTWLLSNRDEYIQIHFNPAAEDDGSAIYNGQLHSVERYLHELKNNNGSKCLTQDDAKYSGQFDRSILNDEELLKMIRILAAYYQEHKTDPETSLKVEKFKLFLENYKNLQKGGAYGSESHKNMDAVKPELIEKYNTWKTSSDLYDNLTAEFKEILPEPGESPILRSLIEFSNLVYEHSDKIKLENVRTILTGLTKSEIEELISDDNNTSLISRYFYELYNDAVPQIELSWIPIVIKVEALLHIFNNKD
jgi:hypothetical protein